MRLGTVKGLAKALDITDKTATIYHIKRQTFYTVCGTVNVKQADGSWVGMLAYGNELTGELYARPFDMFDGFKLTCFDN